jgi:hypothetical protein
MDYSDFNIAQAQAHFQLTIDERHYLWVTAKAQSVGP